MSRTALVLAQVSNERAKQDARWGLANPVNRSNAAALAVLMEEVGEAAKACLEGDDRGFRDELIQVAAVAVAAIEASFDESLSRPEPKET